ncbi:hypothetical protein D3C72_1280660 [compost metagenome]
MFSNWVITSLALFRSSRVSNSGATGSAKLIPASFNSKCTASTSDGVFAMEIT